MSNMQINIETITVIVNVFLVLLIILQIIIQRSHNIKTVQPYISAHNIDNKINNGEYYETIIYVKNSGNGIGIIKDFKYIFDNEVIIDILSKNKKLISNYYIQQSVKRLLTNIVKLNFDIDYFEIENVDTSIFKYDYVMAPGDKIDLIKIKYKINDIEKLEKYIGNQINKMHIEYECVYGTKHIYNT